MKCIHFPLPSGAGGMAAAHVLGSTRTKLTKFCEKHKIESYYSKTEGYNYYVWFTDEMVYSLFVLVWEDPAYWRRAQIIEKDRPEDCRLSTVKT